MKNRKKVLRIVSEADFERFFRYSEIRRFTGKRRLPKLKSINLDKFKIGFHLNLFISAV